MSDLKKHIGNDHTVQCIICVPRRQRVRRGGPTHIYERTETGEYKCPYNCTETKRLRSTLREHIVQHHAEEAGLPVVSFECEYCHLGFLSSSARLHHIKNHHEITLTACPHEGCNYPAKNQAALQTHYARKHLDISRCIMQLRDDKYACFKCETRDMKEPATWYHASGCHPESPFKKVKK